MADPQLYLTEKSADKIARHINGPGGEGPGVLIPQDRQLAWVNYKCTAACPAHGVMRITGAALNSNNWPTLTTVKPDTTFARWYLVNGPNDAVDGGDSYYYGVGTYLWHGGQVLYDTGNTPAYGETWGPIAAQWYVTKNRWGFNINGGNAGSGSTSRTGAIQHIVNHVLGKTNASHAKSASGTVNLYTGTLGSETQVTSMTVTAYNRFAAVASGKWVHCSWVNGGFDLSAAEC